MLEAIDWHISVQRQMRAISPNRMYLRSFMEITSSCNDVAALIMNVSSQARNQR
jgi:hypothetical protein